MNVFGFPAATAARLRGSSTTASSIVGSATSRRLTLILVCMIAAAGLRSGGVATAADTDDAGVLPPLSVRFATEVADGEVPDFQRHIGPLLGHLGCNGRACHGSFQGRGGFTLSLFGYDFAADHAAMADADSGRVDAQQVDESLILYKPIDADRHEGGKRMDAGDWQYRVLRRWISGGAVYDGKLQALEHLEVTPAEIVIDSADADVSPISLRAIAHWADGTREDVTELCRFTSNDDSVATVSADGRVTSAGSGDTHVVVAYDRAVVPIAVLRAAPHDLARIAPPPTSDHPIDRLVGQKLDKLRIVPSGLCDDNDFIRRASLDLTGVLPSAERVARFVADSSPDKRREFIDELLADPGYAAWWATRLSDWTGNNEAQLNNYLPVRGMASKMWFEWLRKRLADNVPYDQIVEGIVMAESRLPDESFQEYCETMSDACRTGDASKIADRPGLPAFWARNNFRMTEERAIGFAYSFLGVRIQCAQCHKHPFDRWSKDDFDQFAAIFAPVRATPNSYARESLPEMRQMLATITEGKELRGGELRKQVSAALMDGAVVPFPELTIDGQGRRKGPMKGIPGKGNAGKGGAGPVRQGRILGESETVVIKGDPRDALMDWLRSPSNPYFAKGIVNRVWANYFGVGIVNPIDDLNLGNPPSNAPLLDHLAEGLIASGFDLHWLHREIMTSDTYQRSSLANVTNAKDYRNFSRHVPRRLPAEVLRDSMFLATAGADAERAARADLKGLAIGGQVNPARRGRGDFALQIFGQSTRESNCDCDRSDQANLLQSIFRQNDFEVHQAIRNPDGWVGETTAGWVADAGSSVVTAKGDEMRVRFENRVEQFVMLPQPQKNRLRPRLRGEIENANRRRVQRGLEPLVLAEMIRQAQDRLAQADNAEGEPDAEMSDEMNAEMSDEMSADGDTEMDAQMEPDMAETPIVDRPRQVRRKLPGGSPVKIDDATIESTIRGAYLRTLCRHPDAEELAASISHVRDAENAAAGIQAVMWALLNTKEFVLTH